MAREPIPTWFVVLVVVRRGDRFLVVQERERGQPWYLPAGRVEPGEDLLTAARRETLEEAGIPIVIEGLVRIEHSPRPHSARVRAVFLARPADDTPPKQTPDAESLGAAWVTLEELATLRLRSPEVEAFFRHVAAGAPIYPLTLLASEGDPLPALPPGGHTPH
ncbi:MAG TPA: NUDIX domain-containing protein [Polyangia bacterium]|jgi:phosphatase NudJ|nr:NUDIX domain-containing protein [Polyangia bacterium]